MVTAIETKFVGDTSRAQANVNIIERLQPSYYTQERDRIFRRAWLPVANLCDLSGNNSYVLTQIPTLGASLLITRDAIGKYHAFHNICRHRGNQLVKNDGGCARTFSCGFHGWTYTNDGKLVGVTDKTQFTGLDPTQFGLLPLQIDIWQEYVFVNFDAEPRETLREWLDVLYDQYEGYFSGRERIASYKIVVNCNWNLAVNSFAEGYHAVFLHKMTVPNYQGGDDNPARHRAYIELMTRHGRYSVLGNPNRELTPAEDLAFRYGKRLYPSFPPYQSEQTSLPRGLNPTRHVNWSWDVLEMFPHCIFIMGAHWHATLWFWPIDVERTEIRVEFFAYKAESVGDHLAHAYFRKLHRDVFREDVETMEAVGANLRSGAMSHIVLSKQEMLLQQHYRAAADMVGEA